MSHPFDPETLRWLAGNAPLPTNLTSRAPSNLHVPGVVERTPYGERSWDIYSRMFKDRIIFIGTPIDDVVANAIVAQLLFLQNEDSTKDISMYINSPGGSIYAGLAIYDTMQYIKPDVATFCMGMSMSMGAVLLAAGSKGKRYALPHSTILIHQPLGGAEGQAADIEITAREILRLRDALYSILSKHTGQTVDVIKRDSDRNYYLSAQDAVTYGLIDEVLEPAAVESPATR